MKEFDSPSELHMFSQKIYDVLNAYLEDSTIDLGNDVLAINENSVDFQVVSYEFAEAGYDKYSLRLLICQDEESGNQIDIDEVDRIANKYFFLR